MVIFLVLLVLWCLCSQLIRFARVSGRVGAFSIRIEDLKAKVSNIATDIINFIKRFQNFIDIFN